MSKVTVRMELGPAGAGVRSGQVPDGHRLEVGKSGPAVVAWGHGDVGQGRRSWTGWSRWGRPESPPPGRVNARHAAL